jgi:hypothetical protein
MRVLGLSVCLLVASWGCGTAEHEGAAPASVQQAVVGEPVSESDQTSKGQAAEPPEDVQGEQEAAALLQTGRLPLDPTAALSCRATSRCWLWTGNRGTFRNGRFLWCGC